MAYGHSARRVPFVPTPVDLNTPFQVTNVTAVVSFLVNGGATFAGTVQSIHSIGYATGTGVGTAVVQSGTSASPVTANAICGNIKTVTSSWTAGIGNGVQFAVTNTFVAATDTIIVNQVNTTGANVPFIVQALASTNSFTIGLVPTSTATSLASVNFAVFKASSN